MKALITTMMSLTLFLGTAVSAPPLLQQVPREIGREIGKVRPQRPGPGRNLRAPDAAAPIQEMIEGFYVSRLQQELDLDDEQSGRILPLLRELVRERNELGQRRA